MLANHSPAAVIISKGVASKKVPIGLVPRLTSWFRHQSNLPRKQNAHILTEELRNDVRGLHKTWRDNPDAVPATWKAFFEEGGDKLAAGLCALSSQDNQNVVLEGLHDVNPMSLIRQQPLVDPDHFRRVAGLVQLVKAYQQRGHLFAKVDPLELPTKSRYQTRARQEAIARHGGEINVEDFGLRPVDMQSVIDVQLSELSGLLGHKKNWSLEKWLSRLNEIYCSTIGYDYMHISDPDRINWLQSRVETVEKPDFDDTMKMRILHRTCRAYMFERFLAVKYPTTKRFGLDGVESLTVALKAVTKAAAGAKVEDIVLGMAHRGRLNVLTNVMHKPMRQMLQEFQGLFGYTLTDWGNTGDVKYHLGVEYDHTDPDTGNKVHLALLPNPSHLETVDPVVLGRALALQNRKSCDKEMSKKKVLPILIHGDASIAGQGIVYETAQMSKLPGYDVGGTIHIVANNQIGFTTLPMDSCSGVYCTDLAKAIEAPIFHVNANDPEACSFVGKLAEEYRRTFCSDVFIDIVGYRRMGHNELDMPRFTQPLMYQKIVQMPSVLDIYSQRLITTGVCTSEDVENVKNVTMKFYEAQYNESKESRNVTNPNDYRVSDSWSQMLKPKVNSPPVNTGVDATLLREIGTELSKVPAHIALHPTIKKLYAARTKMIETGKGLDYGMAETLAVGTLLTEGFSVRIAGQDAQRGTFSHRHAVVHDQNTGENYCPLQNLPSKGKYQVVNSLLSEYAALGFEIGYGMQSPNILPIWEAQFGDFMNGAQIMIDQFISSMETKWGRQSAITLFLPHGYDGQGPEHSSARIERFLQLCDDRADLIDPIVWSANERQVVQKHNMQVVNCSTPANFFHVIRRQMCRHFRKPLIVFTPKKMLKMRQAVSDLSMCESGLHFTRYYPNNSDGSMTDVDDAKIKRLVLCSGQVYYSLVDHRAKHQAWDVAVSRVEQISPFPFDLVSDEIRRYVNLQSVVWAQEEPMNQGCWSYVQPRVTSCLHFLEKPNGLDAPLYVGRDVCGSTAVGCPRLHSEEEHQLLHDAFDLSKKSHSYYELHAQRMKAK